MPKVHKLEKKNLVVLRYAYDKGYLQVTPLRGFKEDEKVQSIFPNLYATFSVNFRNKTWTFRGETMEIGRRRYLTPSSRRSVGHSYCPIGVYDKTSIEHLERMVYSATEAVKDR